MQRSRVQQSRTAALERKIEDIQKTIALLEAPYARATARVRGEDEEWNQHSGLLVNRILRLVKEFKIGDNGEKAIAIVAQCAIMAHEITGAENTIDQMKEQKQLLLQAQQELEIAKRSLDEN